MGMNVWYCGFNGFGQLPSESSSTVNQLIEFPDLTVRDVSLSWSYMTMLTDVGVYLSGFVEGCPNQLKKLSFINISQASCCERHLLCVETSGKGQKYCKNTGAQSRLVDFSADDLIRRASCGYTFDAFVLSSGQAVAALSVIHLPTDGEVVDVACGNEHCILLTKSGAVFSWGNGSRGQLGHGDLEREEGKARQIEMLAGLRVTNLASGAWHSAAVTDAGDLYTWGWNNKGQLGLPCATDSRVGDEQKRNKTEEITVQSIPSLVTWAHSEDVTVLEASCGSRHTVVRTDGGCVWGCGWNAYGQLGRPAKELEMTWKMVQLHLPNSIACGVRCGAWSTVILSHE